VDGPWQIRNSLCVSASSSAAVSRYWSHQGLRWLNIDVVVRKDDEYEKRRVEGRVWPSQAHTMIGRDRLDSLQSYVQSVLRASRLTVTSLKQEYGVLWIRRLALSGSVGALDMLLGVMSTTPRKPPISRRPDEFALWDRQGTIEK
jgi:Macrocin-O-methyltransferase (TylF)